VPHEVRREVEAHRACRGTQKSEDERSFAVMAGLNGAVSAVTVISDKRKL
jgi:hypothetical protein